MKLSTKYFFLQKIKLAITFIKYKLFGGIFFNSLKMNRHSIIIPNAGRPIAIRSAIESILRQNINDFDAELIIVDSNTEEKLSSELSDYCKQWSGRLHYVQEL